VNLNHLELKFKGRKRGKERGRDEERREGRKGGSGGKQMANKRIRSLEGSNYIS
jgi:hypothetical protein